MSDKLESYRRAAGPVKGPNLLWPLYGAGLDNFGRDGHPIEAPLPEPGAEELLVRHDAVGLCFSDIKVINLGQNHPRIFRDIRQDPVVLGHEVSMTVVKVGQDLRDQYKPGDRFIIQADVWVDGVNISYGYMLQGGLSKYNIIDRRHLHGDEGNYLIPVQPGTGYAESALTEPWACVTAAYTLEYRSAFRPGGDCLDRRHRRAAEVGRGGERAVPGRGRAGRRLASGAPPAQPRAGRIRSLAARPGPGVGPAGDRRARSL